MGSVRGRTENPRRQGRRRMQGHRQEDKNIRQVSSPNRRTGEMFRHGGGTEA